jgi:nicotinamide phosphoribosyltransferase
MDHLIDEWYTSFFIKPREKIVKKYQRRVSNIVGYEVKVEHVDALHRLGYLPIEIKALPEGSFVPYGVPMLTIKNTHPDFFWVTNMLESVLSAELWQPITSATTYMAYKKLAHEYAELTGGDKSFIPYQLHDFSFRGMAGRHAAAISTFAVLASGSHGTDTVPAIDLAEDYYGADSDNEIVGTSIPATEHSVMCSGTKEDEFETYKRLITKVYPSGFIAIVSDTWDFWKVVTEYLADLKDEIMARDGRVVIRPDSGDPVDIVCGLTGKDGHIIQTRGDGLTYLLDNEKGISRVVNQAEVKGLIECLWDTFGGTINEAGYKVLDPHIGAIYGDSITYDRAEDIFERLKEKGFASTNIVLGIGSYTYQMVTRDTHGMAMKSTYAEINGQGVEIFKDPITDNGIKKSAKGLLMVYRVGNEYKLDQSVSTDQERHGCLETVFKNGELIKKTTLAEIREITNQGF